MVNELNECDYLKKVYIALSVQTEGDYEQALRFSRNFKTPCDVIWCNKPEVISVLEELKKRGFVGKGQGLMDCHWHCFAGTLRFRIA